MTLFDISLIFYLAIWAYFGAACYSRAFQIYDAHALTNF